jgi:hypothetical protein
MRLFRRRPAAPPPPVPLDLAVVLDQLAEAYGAGREAVDALLSHYARRLLALDVLMLAPLTPDHEIAMATTDVDAARKALLTYCTTEDHR